MDHSDALKIAQAEAESLKERTKQRNLELHDERQWRRQFLKIASANMDSKTFWSWVDQARANVREMRGE